MPIEWKHHGGYPVKSTSQGVYGQMEQTSEVMIDTYKMCKAVGARTLLWTTGLQ